MDEIKIGEILEPGGEHKQRSREERVRATFWKTVRKAAKNIPFLDEVVAGYFCALDPATPTKVRGILLASLAYFVLPLDFVPDFILGLGFTDDVAVMMAALSAIRNNITPAHRAAARQAIEELDTDAAR